MALGKYNTALKNDEIAEKTKHLLDKYAAENNTPEVKKFLFNCIDLTTLKCTDSEESVMKFTERVNAFDDELRVGRIPLFANIHRSKDRRDRHGTPRRSR